MCNSELGVTLQPKQGSRCPAECLTDLDFADDIALVSETITNAQALLQKLATTATTVGLIINQSKTKATIIGNKPTGEQISLKTGNIDTVDDFCYLGSRVAMSSRDINIRNSQAWTAINKLSIIWNAPQLSHELKICIFRATVKAVLLYGSQCWTLTVAQERSLDGTYTCLLRKARNISYRDHISNITLYGSLPRISSTLRSRRLQFAGHSFRRVGEPIHSVLLFKPTGTFRPGGHARMTYIKTLLFDSGLSTIADLSQAMASRAVWCDICNVAGVDVDASTVST